MNSDSTEPEIDWAYVVAQHGKRFKSNGSAARSHDALAKQFQCIKKDNGYTNEKLSNAELKVKLITDYKIELEDCTPENVYDATPIRHSKVDMDSHLTKRDGVIAAEYIVAAVNRLGRTVEKVSQFMHICFNNRAGMFTLLFLTICRQERHLN